MCPLFTGSCGRAPGQTVRNRRLQRPGAPHHSRGLRAGEQEVEARGAPLQAAQRPRLRRPQQPPLRLRRLRRLPALRPGRNVRPHAGQVCVAF
jgi:hypothetical protein